MITPPLFHGQLVHLGNGESLLLTAVSLLLKAVWPLLSSTVVSIGGGASIFVTSRD
jgi:hypothetical protein